jgi:hypothetical protein
MQCALGMRLLAANPMRRTFRFVAFPCEEQPHFYFDTMGSQQYARGCRARRDQIVGMICLEISKLSKGSLTLPK